MQCRYSELLYVFFSSRLLLRLGIPNAHTRTHAFSHILGNQVQAIPGDTTAAAAGLIGVAANLLPLIGLNCNPISVLGAGGNNCAAQPVCCTGNNFVRGMTEPLPRTIGG